MLSPMKLFAILLDCATPLDDFNFFGEWASDPDAIFRIRSALQSPYQMPVVIDEFFQPAFAADLLEGMQRTIGWHETGNRSLLAERKNLALYRRALRTQRGSCTALERLGPLPSKHLVNHCDRGMNHPTLKRFHHDLTHRAPSTARLLLAHISGLTLDELGVADKFHLYSMGKGESLSLHTHPAGSSLTMTVQLSHKAWRGDVGGDIVWCRGNSEIARASYGTNRAIIFREDQGVRYAVEPVGNLAP